MVPLDRLRAAALAGARQRGPQLLGEGPVVRSVLLEAGGIGINGSLEREHEPKFSRRAVNPCPTQAHGLKPRGYL
jgi:hypothetical protein